MAEVALPKRGSLPKTNEEDPVDYYYGLTGPLYRGRLSVAARLLGAGHRSLLDVGYGSGIFFPELARRAERLVGVEVHGQEASVRDALRGLGVEVELRPGSILELPADAGEFDAVVSLSVLEHLRELGSALRELRRVLAHGGLAVLGFPVRQPLTDAFFRIFGFDPRELHPSSHKDILRAAESSRSFEVERVAHFPRGLPLAVGGYAACRLRAV
jgi:SAM-dependent methyltransferase